MYAGLDIGGTHARLQVFDDDFRPTETVRRRVRGATAPQQIVATIAELLEPHHGEFRAVGIGLAGLLSPDGRFVHNSPNLHWRNVDLGALLDAELEVPFKVANDLNAMLWGEHKAGAVQDAGDVLAVYVGTGVGGAILMDGQLLLGGGGKAGEIGHTRVVPGGLPCLCGESGCVEAYAGGVHLEQMVARAVPDLAAHAEASSLAAADALYDSSDAVHEIWNRATDFLALVIANSCTLLNPSVLLLGGGVLANLPQFRSVLLEKIPPLMVGPAREDLDIRLGVLEEAAVLGAAMLAAELAQQI